MWSRKFIAIVIWSVMLIATVVPSRKEPEKVKYWYERISTDERSIVNTHSIDITAKFAVSIKKKQDRLPTLYWLPKLHKRPYKALFIANSSSCTTTVLSKLLTSCLTAVKKHWIRYYDTVYERDGINYFWSIKNSNHVLNKFKSKNFQASKLSTYDFSTLYTTLPHHLIKDKLIDLINRMFIRENTQYLACNEECVFFTSDVYNNHNLWSCQKSCDALVYLLDKFLLDLELNFIGKLLVFRWELIMLILFLCFSVLLVLLLPRLGKRELILVLFVRLFDLCLFGFVGFPFLLGSENGCGLWLWHSLDFSLTLFFHCIYGLRLAKTCLSGICWQRRPRSA